MKRKRCILYIDGSNLFGGISELLQPGQYIDFATLLIVIRKDLQIDEVKFYGTYMQIESMKSSAHRLLVGAQKAFFDSAKNCQEVTFFKGHFSGAGKEKGVDVKLAVDMAIGACSDLYDEAIIMTGDADLKYGVEIAKQYGKRVHVAAFGSRFPFGIAPLANKKFVYDFNGFFKKNVMPSYQNKPKGLTVKEISGEIDIYLNKKPDGVRRGSN